MTTQRAQRALQHLLRVGLPVLAATAIVSGQGRGTQQAPRPLPGQQGATFRAAANYVSSIIIPRDAQNRFINNMRKDEFQVYEDDVRQTIETFIPNIGGRAMGSVAARPVPAVREGIIVPPSAPPQDVSGRVFVIFIDDLHLQPGLTPNVRDLMTKIKETLLHEGDLIAIVSSGPSSIEVNLTYDLSRMDEAKSKVMGSGTTPKDIILMPDTAQGPPLLRYNVRVAFGTAYDLMAQLGKITNKRKSIIYISSGFDFNPFKDSRLQHEQDLYAMPDKENIVGGRTAAQGNYDPTVSNPYEKQGQQFADTDLVAELAELVRTANRNNVVFYTIDPRGLVGPTSDISDDLSAEEWRSFVMTTQSSLRVLADETGGLAVVNRNNFIQALKEIDSLSSDYYVLGYYTTNPDPLKRVRRVRVEVTRPGVHLAPYRNIYTLERPKVK